MVAGQALDLVQSQGSHLLDAVGAVASSESSLQHGRRTEPFGSVLYVCWNPSKWLVSFCFLFKTNQKVVDKPICCDAKVERNLASPSVAPESPMYHKHGQRSANLLEPCHGQSMSQGYRRQRLWRNMDTLLSARRVTD